MQSETRSEKEIVMYRSIWRINFLFTLCALLMAIQSAGAANLALLVQVAKYKTVDGYLGGQGSAVDAARMKDALAKRFGFQCTILQDENATHKRILAALGDMAKKAKPDDALVFYFSGHGSTDGNGFTLCSYDTTKKNADKDISCADIDYWLKKLPTRNITIILDCCFSKLPDGSRDAVVKPKHLGHEENSINATYSVINIAQEGVVFLLPCDPGFSNTAYEIQANTKDKYGNNDWIGFFTRELCVELNKAEPQSATYETLIKHVGEDMAQMRHSENIPSQVPTIEGSKVNQERTLFSSPDGKPPIPPATPLPQFCSIKKISESSVTLDQGSISGVKPGSHYAVYPPGAADLTDPTKKLGDIVVQSVGADTSIATPLIGTSLDKLSLHCRTVEIKHEVEIPLVPAVVKVEGITPADAALAADLQARLNGGPVVFTAQKKPDLTLKVKTDAKGVEGDLMESDGVTPLDNNYPVIQVAGRDALIERVHAYQNQFTLLNALLKMNNPNPGLSINLNVGKGPVYVGDKVSFTCTPSQDCYLLVISLDANNAPVLLFPGEDDTDNLVKKGELFRLPSDPKKIYPVMTPDGRNAVIALAITDNTTADQVRNILQDLYETATAVSPGKPGSRGVKYAIDALQSLQSSLLTGWCKEVATLEILPASAKK